MQWQDVTLGKRIAGAFGLVLLVLAAVAILSYAGVGNIVADADQVIRGNRLDSLLAQKEVDHLNWAGHVAALLGDEGVTSLEVETDDHKCGLGTWLYGAERQQAEQLVPSLAPLLKGLELPHQQLHESALAVAEAYRPADVKLPLVLLDIEVAHLQWAGRIRDALINGSAALEGVQTDPAQCLLGRWILSEEAKKAYRHGSAAYRQAMDEVQTTHRELHGSAEVIARSLAQGRAAQAREQFRTLIAGLLGRTLQLLRTLRGEAEAQLNGLNQARAIYANQTKPALDQVQQQLHAIRQEARSRILNDQAMLASARHSRFSVLVVSGMALLVGIGGALATGRGLLGIFRGFSGRLDQGAASVTAASDQVAMASHRLAEAASEQAAALEEISASLEELTTMTAQSAENADKAEGLMEKAGQVVGRAEQSMAKLTSSMQEISEASESTSKIIKTIDEIAFQTNMLALNAAVEAARAGEHGAGFAVVAEEVRSLAKRAAEAARETSVLIESTVQKVGTGALLVQETGTSLQEVSEANLQINDLISEIAEASKEQAVGIKEIGKAMLEMDTVTQQNTANAAESASAAEELNAQALQMRDIVDEMVALVSRKRASGRPPKPASRIKDETGSWERLPAP